MTYLLGLKHIGKIKGAYAYAYNHDPRGFLIRVELFHMLKSKLNTTLFKEEGYAIY